MRTLTGYISKVQFTIISKVSVTGVTSKLGHGSCFVVPD